jgi:WD40 repeat protein
VFEGYQEPITALAITPDGKYALFGSGHFIREVELATEKIVRTFRGHGDDVTTIAINPKQQIMVSGSRDKTVRVWTLTSGRCLNTFSGHTEGVTAVALTPDGEFAISASLDKSLRIWNLKNGACVSILQGHTSHITAVVVTPDAQFVISAGRDRTLRLWRIATGKCLRVFQEFSHWLEDLVLTPDGQCALLGNHEEMRLKHLPSQTYRQILNKYIPHSSQSSTLHTGTSSTQPLTLHNLPPGENFLTIIGREEEKTFTVATPDGTIGISGGSEETLFVWTVHDEHKHRVWGMRGFQGLQVFKMHRNV